MYYHLEKNITALQDESEHFGNFFHGFWLFEFSVLILWEPRVNSRQVVQYITPGSYLNI